MFQPLDGQSTSIRSFPRSSFINPTKYACTVTMIWAVKRSEMRLIFRILMLVFSYVYPIREYS